MDVKKMIKAHQDMTKCLTRSCGHDGLSKCAEKIADAHKLIGDQLKDEAEKASRGGDITKFDALDRTDPSVVQKAASAILSASPTEIE